MADDLPTSARQLSEQRIPVGPDFMTDAEATRLLFCRDEPTQADIAIVFGAADEPLSRARARHAAWLYHEGYAPIVLLTGGTRVLPSTTEAAFMAGVLAELDVPQAAILLEVESRNTVENIRNVLRLLNQRKLLSANLKVLLVSCPWHMRRILHTSKRLFPAGVRLISTPHSECCTAENWSRSSACRSRIQNELRLLGAISLGSPQDRR